MRPRVAIDGRRLQDRPLGGVGRALAAVAPLVAEGADVVVLTDARRPPPELGRLAPYVRPLGALGPVEAPWLHVSVARWLRHWDGVFHGTFNQLPFVGCRAGVVTIHDLSFEVHPEDFTPGRRAWFRVQARAAARSARVVLTPTRVVGDHVVDLYGVPADRVVVAPNAVDAVFGPRTDAEIAGRLAGLRLSAPYVIALGGARRRGLPVAIEAWERCGARAGGVGLVVVGPEAPPSRPGLTWAGVVDDDTWAALLAGAVAFCYPTRFEGFGLPALESAACATPVVAARLPALLEVLGDAAEWCSGTGPDEVAAGLGRVVGDPAHRAALGSAARARAVSAPTWADSAAVTLDAYRRASA